MPKCFRNITHLRYSINKPKDKIWKARIPTLYLIAYGKTRFEAISNLAAMESDALKAEKELGNPIPCYQRHK